MLQNAAYPLSTPSSLQGTRIDVIPLHELEQSEIAQWKALSQAALEPNPFIEPEYICSAVPHLTDHPVSLLVLRGEHERWRFATPVVPHRFEFGNPLPKLRALRTIHTYLNQPLVERVNPVATLTELFDGLSTQRNWHGLGFSQVVENSDLHELLNFAAATTGVVSHELEKRWRPAARPRTQAEILETCSKSRRRSLRKAWSNLAAQGEVSFQLRFPTPTDEDSIEKFLQLEAAGWKAEQGTALQCDEQHIRFFHKMCQRFAASSQVCFGELSLNDQLIASTCNLISGTTLFAFKVGWDQKFSDCSLGYWSEILLSDAIASSHPGIQLIDSCSDEDSYTAKLYPDQRLLTSQLFVWSRRANTVQALKSRLKATRDAGRQES